MAEIVYNCVADDAKLDIWDYDKQPGSTFLFATGMAVIFRFMMTRVP
jgi:hypothetical protein